jgi:hypothetical protein
MNDSSSSKREGEVVVSKSGNEIRNQIVERSKERKSR